MNLNAITILVLTCVTAACFVQSNSSVAADDFQATVGRSDTSIRFSSENGKTVVDIKCDFGIDQATIKRLADNWPMTVVARLHLKGLESFQVTNEKVAVHWSVASTGGNVSRVSLVADGREMALDEQSPYHTVVRIVGGNGKIPLANGYFEVPLPAKLLDGNPKEITLRWVDFYR